MPLLSESPDVLPIHRRILAFAFIGWLFDFYDLLLLSFLVASTTLTTDLALTQGDLNFGSAWMSGRVKLEAGLRDVLRLRKLL